MSIARASLLIGVLSVASGLKQTPEPRALGAVERKEALHSRELAFEDRMTEKAIRKEARAKSKSADEAWRAKHAMEGELTIAKRAAAAKQNAEGFAAMREVQQFQDRVKSAAKMAVEKAEAHIIAPGEDAGMTALATATGISTKLQLQDFATELAGFLPNSTFLKELSKAHEESVAEFAISARRRLALLRERNVNATEREVVANVGETLVGWRSDFLRHQAEAAKFRSTVVDQLPKAMMTRVAPMVALMSPNVQVHVNIKDFKNASATEGCSKVLGLMKEVAPHYARINEAETLLAASAAMVPHMRALRPQPSEQAISVVRAFVKLGYVEALGAQTASQDLISSLGPVLVSQLHCLSAAGSAHSFGFVALLVTFTLTFVRLA